MTQNISSLIENDIIKYSGSREFKYNKI
jgi:hypothetical protein